MKLAVVDGETERETITIDAASRRRHRPLRARWRARLAELVPLAPLHQPLSLTMAEVIRRELDLPVVACFDTASHAALSEAATRYGLPRDWVRDFGLRRYGFHRLSSGAATAAPHVQPGDADPQHHTGRWPP